MISLEQLTKELNGAGFLRPIVASGTDIYWVGDDGNFMELTQEAQAIVDAHVPAVTRFKRQLSRSPIGEVRWMIEEEFQGKAVSVGTTPVEVFRLEILQLTVYSVYVMVMAVDRGNGNVKKASTDVTLKRLNAGPLLVGRTDGTVHQDTNAASWTITPSFDTTNGKNDAVITVTGAASRTIDWFVTGSYIRFSPREPDIDVV